MITASLLRVEHSENRDPTVAYRWGAIVLEGIPLRPQHATPQGQSWGRRFTELAGAARPRARHPSPGTSLCSLEETVSKSRLSILRAQSAFV
jgi:hypothetical protein